MTATRTTPPADSSTFETVEAEPLGASWHSNKFLDPVGDGAVLPILHLDG